MKMNNEKIEYSKEKLQELADADLIWVNKSEYYQGILKKSIENKGWDYSQLDHGNQCSDIIHEELWWDVCKIVNDLAQLILNERNETECMHDSCWECRGTMRKRDGKRCVHFMACNCKLCKPSK